MCFFIKLGRHVSHGERMNSIDFRGHRSKMKVLRGIIDKCGVCGDATLCVVIFTILIWLDSFPLLSQRTRTVLYSPDISTGSKPRPPVLHLTAVSCVNFSFSFFHKKDISWVIIRIEIKMKSSALLPSNLPRVIDRSNLSPRRFAAQW